ILNLTMETRRRLPLVTLCVTVPHTLSLSDQAKLAKHLEQEGADIIQTQGGKCSNPSNPGLSVATAPMAITTGVAGVVNLLPNLHKVQAPSPKTNLCRIHAPWQEHEYNESFKLGRSLTFVNLGEEKKEMVASAFGED
ncbi:putative aldolase-type TIM barrel containing protein, partial [Tanacetum coccineum]